MPKTLKDPHVKINRGGGGAGRPSQYNDLLSKHPKGQWLLYVQGEDFTAHEDALKGASNFTTNARNWGRRQEPELVAESRIVAEPNDPDGGKVGDVKLRFREATDEDRKRRENQRQKRAETVEKNKRENGNS